MCKIHLNIFWNLFCLTVKLSNNKRHMPCPQLNFALRLHYIRALLVSCQRLYQPILEKKLLWEINLYMVSCIGIFVNLVRRSFSKQTLNFSINFAHKSFKIQISRLQSSFQNQDHLKLSFKCSHPYMQLSPPIGPLMNSLFGLKDPDKIFLAC